MHDKNLISRLINYEGAVFFMIKNAEGKCWLLPERNLYTAMNIYQPSTIKGKILRSYFPFFSKYQAVRKLLDIETYKLELNKLLEKKLKSLFDLEEIEFSIFLGTPSSHQKITMQIYNGSKILGYCKFSDKKEIITLFKQEKQTLDFLKKQGVDQIPICLFSGNFQEDIDFFVQTTKKTNISTQTNKWSTIHEDFLHQLYSKTKQDILFEKSDFYNSLRLLKMNSGFLKKQHRTLILNAIKGLESIFKNRDVNFSIFHGDFTPWNMIKESKKLFVFDFEYSKKTFPPFLDRYHFYTQVCIHEKKWNAKEIYYNYLNKNEVIFKNSKNSVLYMSYLLSVISLYLDREKLYFYNSKETSIWIDLLNLVIEKK